MANNRRMFSNRIANSAKFLQMPESSQLLYFHMVLRADDDGIVEAYPIMKLLGTTPDTFKVLLAKEFIRQLNEDQVVLIEDWLEHNKIRADRKIDSVYQHLLPPDVKIIEPKPRSDVKDNSKRLCGQSTVSISKVKLSKDKISKVNKLPEQSSVEKKEDPNLKIADEIILKYIDIRDVKTKTHKTFVKRLYNFFEKDLHKLEGLCKIVKHYSNSAYPYTIYSTRSLFEKKDKIIARYQNDRNKPKQETKQIIGLEKFVN